MARWRDVKQGNIKQDIKKQNKKTVSNDTVFNNSSLIVRFKAFLTDTFMLTMPLMYIAFYFVMGSREEFAEHKLLGWLYIFLPHFILIFSLWYFKQQTPGLKAYDLKVVDYYTNKKPSAISLVNRYIQTFISIILVLPIFLPYFKKDKRTFQDIISGTYIKDFSKDKE